MLCFLRLLLFVVGFLSTRLVSAVRARSNASISASSAAMMLSVIREFPPASILRSMLTVLCYGLKQTESV